MFEEVWCCNHDRQSAMVRSIGCELVSRCPTQDIGKIARANVTKHPSDTDAMFIPVSGIMRDPSQGNRVTTKSSDKAHPFFYYILSIPNP